MDRLLMVEPKELVMHFELGSKCSGMLHIRNVMHTMPVAFKVQTTAPNKYIVKPSTGVIRPLGTADLEVVMQATAEYPENFPFTKDKFVVKSVVVPGDAREGPRIPPSEWFNCKNKVVFADARLKALVVGSGILRLLLARPTSDMEDIRAVLERDVDVDGVNELEQTAMHIAVASGRPELVQLLLEYAPNLEKKSREGRTPLQDASLIGEPLMVEILLSKGADPDAADARGQTALHLALVGGHLDVVRILLDRGAKADAAVEDGRTAVHIAVEEGLRKSLKVLLENGAFSDASIPGSGQTALHLAAARNDKAMVKLLVRHGASTRIQDRRGMTAADVAADAGHVKLLELLELGEKLRDAARRGDVGDVRRSLEKGASIDGQDGRGWGALHRAAFKGQVALAEFLVDWGADLELRDDEGHTPLHCAVEARQTDVVRLLVTRGANQQAVTKRGASALDIARMLHLPAVLRVLEGEKPDVAPAKPKSVLRTCRTSKLSLSHKYKVVTFDLPDDDCHSQDEGEEQRPADLPQQHELDPLPSRNTQVPCSTKESATDFLWSQKVQTWDTDPVDYSCRKAPSVNIHITICNVDLSQCQNLLSAQH